MADDVKVREVSWEELFPWTMLLNSIRIAFMVRIIVLGAIGLTATALGWWLLGQVFSGSADPVIERWRNLGAPWIWEDSPEFSVATSARSAAEVFYSAGEGLLEAPLSVWLYFTRPFIDLFRAELTPTGFLFLLLCGVWELLVWGIAGGAITRIAALRFTRDEAPGPIAASLHAARRLPSYSVPPLAQLTVAIALACFLAILGLLMRLDLFAFLAGIFWPIVLIFGLMMAVLLLVALASWPLMWATVSVEGTDAFDALSRSFAYTTFKPLRLLWYVVFAALLAIVSMFVVKLFATAAIALGDWSINWGLDEQTMRTVVSTSPASGPPEAAPPALSVEPGTNGSVQILVDDAPDAEEPRELNSLLAGARHSIHFWKWMVGALAAGYQAGFLWVSAVGIYLLLRRDIDGVQIDEVYIDQADEYGMPPLADEATTGVPEVVPNAPARPGDA